MKKVVVIGATGSLAHYVIESIKELQHIELSLFVRNKSRLSKSATEGCVVTKGDATNFNDVKNAITGQDIVYVNLAGNLEAMATNIVKTIQQSGVKRIIRLAQE